MVDKLKILFICGDTSDYLSTSLLHGLKTLTNVDVIDYPKANFLYKKNLYNLKKYLRGNGFTLYFLLNDEFIKRENIKYDLVIPKNYDLIIFGDIKSNFGLYLEYFPWLRKKHTVILDGSDDPSLFGDSGHFWRRPYYWLIPRPQNHFLYFKREWIPSQINNSRFLKCLPAFLRMIIPQKKNLRKISFSIPEEKIITTLPTKTRLFASHIVDEEFQFEYTGKVDSAYIFENESEYYADLQSAKYAITTKRSGWDCLRHYEIAANGAVICFRNLEDKPSTCAPHGLIPGKNCLSYNNYEDLMQKINQIDNVKYLDLQSKSLEWIRENTTKKHAINLILNLEIH